MSKTKGNKKGPGKAIVTLVMIMILLAGGAAVGYGWGTHWTYKRGAGQTTQTGNAGSGTGDSGIIITPGGEHGITLKKEEISYEEYEENGIDAQVEKAYRLTATHTPSEPTDNTVEWEIGWVNEESSWANGKSVYNYITLAVSTDTQTSTVTCQKAFGEPIYIRAEAKNNPTVAATCRVDYVKKVTKATLADIGENFSFQYGYQCDAVATYSDYTIDSETRFSVTCVSMDDGFVDTPYYIKTSDYSDGYGGFDSYNLYSEYFDTGVNSIPFSFDSSTNMLTFNGETFSEAAMGENIPYFDNCLAMCIEDGCDNMFVISFKVETIYDGEVVSSITSTFAPTVRAECFEIKTTDMKLNYNKVIF